MSTPHVATASRALYSLHVTLPSSIPALVNVLLDFETFTYHAVVLSEPDRVELSRLDDRVVFERIDDTHIKARFYSTSGGVLATASANADDYSVHVLYNNSGFTLLDAEPIFPILVTGGLSSTGAEGATSPRAAIPQGVIDGVNDTFTVPTAIDATKPTWAYKNGLFQTPDVDYTFSSNIIVFVAGNEPPSGSNLYAIYFEAP